MYDNDLRLIAQAENLHPDEAVRTLCPRCEGGRTREQSFSVYNHGDFISGRCWRDSCQLYVTSGGIQSTGTKPKTRSYVQPNTLALSDGQMGYMWKRFNLDQSTLERFGVRQLPNPHTGVSLYLPLWGWDNNRQEGYVDRILRPPVPEGRSSKAMTYLSEPSRGIYGQRYGARQQARSWFPLFLVEDYLSMMALHQEGRVAAACLLGTSLTDRAALQIRQWEGPVFMCLDADATRTTLRLMQRLRGLVPEIKGLRLTKDIKDKDINERRNFLDSALSNL